VLPADSADSAHLTNAASANDVPAGVAGGNMSVL
jgi:hypothetical protein